MMKVLPVLLHVSCLLCMLAYVSEACKMDKFATYCATRVSSDDCYSAVTKKICCATCAAMETGLPGCEYGDRDVPIVRNGLKFTCTTYLDFFGKSHCRLADIKRDCCLSCIAK